MAYVSMAYLTKSLKGIDSGICFISNLSTHTILQCSKQFEKISGYLLTEMKEMGQDFFRTIIHPEDFPNVLKVQKKFESAESHFFGHGRMKVKNETEWRWFSFFVTPYTFINTKEKIKEVSCHLTPLWHKSDTPDQTQKAFCVMRHSPFFSSENNFSC